MKKRNWKLLAFGDQTHAREITLQVLIHHPANTRNGLHLPNSTVTGTVSSHRYHSVPFSLVCFGISWFAWLVPGGDWPVSSCQSSKHFIWRLTSVALRCLSLMWLVCEDKRKDLTFTENAPNRPRDMEGLMLLGSCGGDPFLLLNCSCQATPVPLPSLGGSTP
jgi:hypothetical protein